MNGAGSWQPNDLAVAFRAEIFSITTSSGNEDAPTGLEEVSFLGEEFVVRDQGNATDADGGEVNQTGRRRGISRAHRTGLAPAVGAVSQRAYEQRDVMLGGGIRDPKMHRNAIEK